MRSVPVLLLIALTGCPEPDETDALPVDMDRDGVFDDVDCDDTNAEVYPGADEICDELDNDCDGDIDEGAPNKTTFYLDADEDGYGGAESVRIACFAPDGYIEQGGDCADNDPDVHPGVDEICDRVDNNCDDEIDNDPVDGDFFYPDVDKDRFGGDAEAVRACSPISGYLVTGGDCDDLNPNINPMGTEVCDEFGRDEDCDGLVDDADDSLEGAYSWFPDGDGDTFGDRDDVVFGCANPGGRTREGGDCRDDLPAVNPGAAEICENGLDDNCDDHAAECGLIGSYYGSLADAEWYGRQGGEAFGTTVVGLPDVTGDGRGEVAAAATRWTSGSSGTEGRVALLSGPASPGGAIVIADVLWENTTKNAVMGASIAYGSDVNGDGVAELWLGMPGAVTTQIMAVDTSDVSVDAPGFITSTQTTRDLFGQSMVSFPDVTSDGVYDLLVGAPRWNDDGEVGAAFLLAGTSADGVDTSDRIAEIIGDNLGARCGEAVAAPDFDADGEPSAVVGCPLDDSGRGEVLIFDTLPSGAVTPSDADQRESGLATDDALGDAFAWGDMNGDGYDDLAIAASGRGTGSRAGTVYVLEGSRSGTTALSSAARTYTGVTGGDGFGEALAVGDVDDDGKAEVLVGAPRHDRQRGALYIFAWDDGSSGAASAYGTVLGDDERDGFATSVAVAPDLDRDGFNDVAVGAPNRFISTSGQGQVYIFKGGPGY